jgi:hypothetical protein
MVEAMAELIAGLVVLGLGVVIVRFRAPLFKSIVDMNKAAYGKTVGTTMEKKSSPFWVGAAGVGGVVVGLYMVVQGIVRF